MVNGYPVRKMEEGDFINTHIHNIKSDCLSLALKFISYGDESSFDTSTALFHKC